MSRERQGSEDQEGERPGLAAHPAPPLLCIASRKLPQEYRWPCPTPEDTHDEHMATDHQAQVLGEGAHEVYQGWAEVGGAREHQALGAEEGSEKGKSLQERAHGGPDAKGRYLRSSSTRTLVWPQARPVGFVFSAVTPELFQFFGGVGGHTEI